MSVKIKKQTGETFDLPQDFVIEGEKNNPLFSKKGSQTVSISFPLSPRNRQLLDEAWRFDRAEKPGQSIPVVIESGPVQQGGRMAINSASSKTVSANIGFDESDMYSQMSTMQLKDMPVLAEPPYNITPPGATREERVDSLLAHLTAVMKEETEADYYVFPVVLKYDHKDVSEDDQADKHYRIILNELDTVFAADNQNPILPYGAVAELKGLQHQLLIWYINNEEVYIDAMKGYGVSPFLKVGKLLEIIFLNFGYTIEENPFATHPQLKKLVTLNNTMDTILSGTLHYRDLTPDVTVNELLESLYNKFGLLWFVNSTVKTVRLRFLKDLLDVSSAVNIDISPFKTGEPEIAYSAPRQLKLTANREVGASGAWYTSETLYNTFEEFLKAYNFQFTDFNEDDEWIQGVSCGFLTDVSQYGIFENIELTESERLQSSDFFDWDKKTPGLEYEEIQMSDLCLPFDFYRNIMLLHYGAGIKHRYSNVTVNGESGAAEENPAKLAFVFGWGMTDYTDPNRYNWFFASQINRDSRGHFMYDPEGNKYDISLTINREDGLYNRFWKEYDAFLRHSGHEVKCKLKFSDAELINLKMDTVMMLNFQPLLPEQVKFKLNDAAYHANECTFRTLRLYKPYDLVSEQGIPAYKNQKYYWERISVVVTPVLTYPYYEESPFGYGFVTIDGVRKDTRMLFILPPTDEQFEHQEQIILSYQSKAIATGTGIPSVELTTVVTFRPAQIIYPPD